MKKVAAHLHDASWSPTGDLIVATGQYAQTMTIRFADDERNLITPNLDSLVATQDWRPDGMTLTTGGRAGDVYHWDIADTAVRHAKVDAGNSLWVAEWSPDGERFACGYYSPNRVKLFDALGQSVARVAGLGALRDLSWDSTSTKLAVDSSDHKRLSILNPDGEVLVKQPLENVGVPAIDWNPNQPLFALGTNDHVEIRDDKAHLRRRWSSGRVNAVAWSTDGDSIYTANGDLDLRRWTADGRLQTAPHRREKGVTDGVHINPSDGRVATIGYTRNIAKDRYQASIWSNSRFLGAIEPAGGGSKGVAWSPDGTTLSVFGRAGCVQLWAGTPLQHQQTFVVGTPGEAFVVNADGTELLAGSAERFGEHFRFVVETDSGSYKTISHAAFQELVSAAPKPLNSRCELPIQALPLVGVVPEPSREDASPWQVLALGQDRNIRSTAWSSHGDVAVGDVGGTVRILNAEMTKLLQVLPTDSGQIRAMDWSPDGKTLVFGNEFGEIYRYSKDDSLQRLASQHGGAISRLHWKADGTRFVSAGDDKGLVVWDSQGHPISRLSGHTRELSDVAWHPEKQIIASYSQASSELIVWQEDGSRLAAAKHSTVVAIDWMPGTDELYLWGREIDSSTSGLIFNLSTQKTRPTSVPLTNSIIAARLSPDGQTVAIGMTGNALQLFGLDGKQKTRIEGNGPGEWMTVFDWSDDSQRIAFVASPWTLRTADVDGNVLAKIQVSNRESVASWSFDRRFIATAGTDNSIRRWSADGSNVELLDGHDARVRCVAWSPVDSRLASLGNDGKLRVWDLSGNELEGFDGMRIQQDSDGKVAKYQIAWHPSGKMIAAAGATSTLKIVDLETKQVRSFSMLGPVASLAWNAAGDQLAIGCEPKLLVFWKPNEREPKFFSVPTQPDAVQWHGDTEVLVAGQECYRAPINGEQATRFVDSPGRERDVRISPDKQWVAVAADDLELLRPDGNPTSRFANPDSTVVAVAWSSDGALIAATYNDSALRVWDLATGKVQWIGLPVDGGDAVTFSPSGEVLAGNAGKLDQTHQVIRYVDHNGLETVKPSEFFNAVEARQ